MLISLPKEKPLQKEKKILHCPGGTLLAGAVLKIIAAPPVKSDKSSGN